MRFISELSFFVFPKGRVLLGFLAVLLTFPACQNPSSNDPEDTPSPPADSDAISITLGQNNQSFLLGHIFNPTTDVTLSINGTDQSNLRSNITSNWNSSTWTGGRFSATKTETGENRPLTVYYNGKKQDTPLTPEIKPLDFRAGSISGTASPAFNTVVYGGNTWYAGAKSTTGNERMVYSSSNLSSWTGAGPTGDTTEITAGLYVPNTSGTSGIFVLAYNWGTDVPNTSPNRATIGYSTDPNGNPSVNSMVSPGTGVNSRYIYSGGTEQAGNIARIKGLAFGGDGRFVAVGNLGMVARSNVIRSNTDVPNAWEVATSVAPFYRAGSINCVIFDGIKFIAGGKVGNASKIITSTDGFNWTTSTNTNVAGEIKSMAYCKDFGGKYVLVTALTDSYGFIYHSTDGLTWTMVTSQELMINPALFNAVAYNGDGLFVAVGKSGNVGKIAYSVDGENWNLYPSPNNFNGVEFTAVAGNGKGEFVVVGNNSSNQGKIFYSKLD